MNEFVDFMHTGDEIEIAEMFVKYWKLANTGDDLATANEIELTADDMNNFELGKFLEFMGNFLGEVIFSEEIESSAWWKERS